MKIEMKDSSVQKAVAKLDYGQVFIDEDGWIGMLINDDDDDDVTVRDCDRRAVFLADGGTFDIGIDEIVTIPKKVTLIIER